MDRHRRPRTGRGLRRALLGVLALLVAATGLLVTPLPAKAEEATKVLLLLDVSGSMNERISSGGTKFAAAQRAVKRVANAVPAGTQVGLRVYGSEIAEPKEQNPKACTDTKLVLPIGPLNRRQLFRAVDSFEAKGETPIAYSLGKAVDDLGPSGKRVLILISDGEESCDGDPCPAARRLAKAGVDLQFNAIGLAVNSKARSQLQCIAKAGDGNYYDANNTSDLEDAVRRITQRALRPFQTSGTPVEGTVDQAGAPSIRVGQYKDTYDAGNTPRYYRVTRTPGSTVTASISTIVRPYPSQNTENWTLTLATPDGTPCATATATSGGYRATTVLSGAVVSSQVDPITRSPGPEPCASAPELLLVAGPELAPGQRGRGVGGGADRRGAADQQPGGPAGARRRLHRHRRGGARRHPSPVQARRHVLLQLHRGQGRAPGGTRWRPGRPSSTAYVWSRAAAARDRRDPDSAEQLASWGPPRPSPPR